jgi:Lrp/AsnC family transcriptional regulator, leucine-responsive regulatory protein
MLDPIDYKLLEILQRNARATQIDLAAAVGLSQPSVAERLRKLEQEGFLLGYAAQVNAVGIGHPKFSVAFAKHILSIPEVLECHLVTGQDSYLLKVKTENTSTLNELITGKIRTIPGVTRTQTTIVLQSIKEGSFIVPSSDLEKSKPKRGKRVTVKP